jgi:hypothetical protein
VKVRCVSGVAPLDTPWGVVRFGDVIEVDPSVAGEPPTARRVAAEAALVAAEHAVPRLHQACADARDALTGLAHEMGWGLLAQTTEWELAAKPVDDPAPAKKSKDGE